MVDPVNSSGQIQNVLSTQQKKSQEVQEQKRAAPTDEVNISEEAIGLAEAERQASEARVALQENEAQVLSVDAERLNALI